MATQPRPEQHPTRTTVHAQHGIACSTSPLAATTGIRVMADGGNAFDAAIAMAAVEAVTVAPMCGLGGETFAILHQAATGTTYGLTSSGAAPKRATPAYYRAQGHTVMPSTGPLAVSPPGEVAAWQLIVDRFCTRPLSTLLEHAIGYAEEGHPLSPRMGHTFTGSAERLAMFPSTAKVFLKPNGTPYGPGDVLVNKDLAHSLRRVAQGGADEFYRGGLARDIARAFQRAGGLITEEDLAAHEAEVYDPVATTYRGYQVVETRPPSQGFMLLEMLNMVEGFDLAGMGHLSAESIHVMIEATKLAFADRNAYMGDPRMVRTPVEELISKRFAERRRQQIDMKRALVQTRVGELAAVGTDTSYFCVADGQGNTVSFIHSLYAGFGSAFVAEGTGIVFNNRARGFRLTEGHPNTLAPGKRPMHTLNAYTVLKDGRPFLVGGTPGADFQVQGNLQMITGVIDFGLDLQQAVDAPRWVNEPGSDPASLDRPYEVRMEPQMPEDTSRALQALGHAVTWGAEGISHGRVQLIGMKPATGVLLGASDYRADGYAAGF